MTIDAHVHIDLKRWKTVKAAAGNLVRDMEKSGVEKAVLLPDNYLNLNEHIEKACALFPGKFYGFGMVNPLQAKGRIKKEMQALTSKKWCKGIKIHPRTQNFNLDAPGVFHIAEFAAKSEFPLTIDCLPIFKFTVLDEKSFPNAFDRLAKNNPCTNIIIAHMGGHRLMDAFAVAKANPNIFLEVSYSFYFYSGSSVENDMLFAIKKLGPQKIIYGSDHPAIGIGKGLKNFKALCDKINLKTADQRYIFGKNISRLINIDPI